MQKRRQAEGEKGKYQKGSRYADWYDRERERERERERTKDRQSGIGNGTQRERRTYYVKGYIVGNGSEVMLIQSEVATELAGFHRNEGRREGEGAQSGREEEQRDRKEKRDGNRGGPIGRKAQILYLPR